jgi:hypothetical protein
MNPQGGPSPRCWIEQTLTVDGAGMISFSREQLAMEELLQENGGAGRIERRERWLS